jgi:hypothetical protein
MAELPNDGAVGSGNPIENFVNNAGNAVFFDAIQNSGNLNNLNGDQATTLVYPDDMHNNPTKGNIIHFDIFYKKPATMEDVTNKIKGGFNSLVDKYKSAETKARESVLQDAINTGPQLPVDSIISDVTSGLQDAKDQLLGAIGGAVNVDMETPDFSADTVDESTRLGKATEKSLDKVTLFMPTGIQNTDSVVYSEQNFAMMKGLLDLEVGALVPGTMSGLASGADSIAAMGGVELNSEAALNAVTGVVSNPRKEQLFNDVSFRTFDFSFNFFPKSKSETETVAEIIKMFRFHAHPEVSSNQMFYSMPSEFQITYVDLKYPSNNPFQQVASLFGANSNAGVAASPNQWLNKIGRCALTNVTTDYTPLGRLTSFANGAPAAITLTLQFTELEAISRNKIKVGY